MKRPLLRFFALGVCLFAVERALPEHSPRVPFAPGSVVSDDELLFAEALARGLVRGDSVVRRRLAANLRFAEGARGRSEDELVRDALALGMHERDLVGRRRLIQRMRLLLGEPGRAAAPSELELARELARHPERFTEPARVRITQIYLGEQRALPFSPQLPPLSEAELARMLGAKFAKSVFALPVQVWSAPLASSVGLHRVRVEERIPARFSPLAVVRAPLREQLLAERAQRALALGLAELRARYGLRAPGAGA
jgi:hypothetical protein